MAFCRVSLISGIFAAFALMLVAPALAQQSSGSSGGEAPAVSQPATSLSGDSKSDVPESATPEPKRQTGQSSEPNLTPEQQVAAWKVEIDNIELALSREGLTEEQFILRRVQAEKILEEAHALESTLEPIVDSFQDRLDELGPAPGDGEPPESEDIKDRREAVSEDLAEVDSVLKKARLASVRAEQIVTKVASMRRARFSQTLLERNRSILNPKLWIDGLKELPQVERSLEFLFSDSWSVAVSRINGAAMALFFGVLGVLGVIGFFLRRLVLNLAPPVGEHRDVSRLLRLSRAILVAITDGAILVATVATIYLALNVAGLLTPRFAEFMRALVLAAAEFGILFGLARGICAPLRPAWRPASLSDTAAAQMVATATLIAVVLALAILLRHLNDLLVAPVAVDIIKRAGSALLVALLVISGLWRLSIEHRAQLKHPTEQPSFLWVWLRGFVWAVAIGIIVALVAGFIALANFVSIQLVFAAVVFASLWLLLGLIEELVNATMKSGNRFSSVVAEAFGIGEHGVVQLALVASGIFRLIVIVFGAVAILLPWGFDTGEWGLWVQKVFFGFRIGGVTISLASILTAVVLFIVGIFGTRAIQRWLADRYLPNTKLDLGLRNSIKTIIGYFGITLAAIFAVTYLGFDLRNVALVAGALSVGIGFGLQSIVNNFVSGLILLAERPIKEGDWIVVGSEQGTVRKISVRSTEIETFDRGTVIVPNSDLITAPVKNWMHSSMMGRVVLPIGVGYDSDPDQVRDILLDVARGHSGVLTYPEPRVYFMDFGDSSLVFNLYAYVSDVGSSLTVRSDFRFEILRRLREASIEIPFPQRDINLRDIDRLESAISGTQLPAPKPEPSGSAE